MSDSKNEKITNTHFSKSGKMYTQELHFSRVSGAAWETIKDQWGKELPMGGSGGHRPWMRD